MQEKVAAWLKKTARRVVCIGGLLAAGYSALKFQSSQSKTQFALALSESQDPNFIGKVQSGDLLYMKHSCLNSFSVSEIRKCYTHSFYKSYIKFTNQRKKFRQSDWDSVGLIVNAKSKRVLFQYFGKFYDMDLEEFVNLPFFSEISLSTFSTDYEKINDTSEAFREKIHHLQSVLNQSWPIRSHGLFRDGVDIVLNYWVFIGFANIDTLKDSLRQTVGDLEKSRSRLLMEKFGSYSRLSTLKSSKN